MSNKFEESFNEYQGQLAEYQEKFDHYKDLLQQGDFENLAREAGLTVGVPIAHELLRAGFNRVTSKSTGASPLAKSEQQPSDGDDDGFTLGEQDAVDGIEPEMPPGPPSFLWSSFVRKLNMPADDLEPATGEAGELASRTTLQNAYLQSDEFGLRGRVGTDLDPEFGEDPERSNIVARLFGERPGPSTAAVDTDADAANAVARAASRNIQAVESVTGADATTAADALAEGASAIQGGTNIIGGITSGASGVAGDVAAGVGSTIESGIETGGLALGAETGGVGYLVAGLAALGGVLADIFAGHHKPKPVPIPNLPAPTFSPGLATGE